MDLLLELEACVFFGEDDVICKSGLPNKAESCRIAKSLPEKPSKSTKEGK